MSTNARQQVRRREQKPAGVGSRSRIASQTTRTSSKATSTSCTTCIGCVGPAPAYSGRDASFHRAFAQAAFRRGWLRLWFLELDGIPVAAWHGYRFAGSSRTTAGRLEPGVAEGSVGTILLSHTIRAAAEDGMDEYRLLRGDETYKSRWATSDHGLVSLVAGNGRAGAMAAIAASRGSEGTRRRSSRGVEPIRQALSSRFTT